MDKIFLAILQSIPGIGSIRLRKLLRTFGNGENIWRAKAADIQQSGCLDVTTQANLLQFRDKVNPECLAKLWSKQQIGLCSIEDQEYPEKLKNIFNPPVVLFYRGNFSFAKKRIAMVGARQATPYGKSMAKILAAALAAAGVEVVSGAARGIDAAAHIGALEQGRTVAVLGCGVDVVYPQTNAALLTEIAQRGLILSEYAPGTKANPKFFPARNRIISGLCDGVVVVEAALKSGSLITAELAVSEGRDVFAVPGNVFSGMSKGCHKLIQQGAKLVENAMDILEEYGLEKQLAVAQPPMALSVEELAIYQVLQYEQPLTIDEIVLKTRSEAANIAFVLLQMELRGIINEYAPRCYVRSVKEDIL